MDREAASGGLSPLPTDGPADITSLIPPDGIPPGPIIAGIGASAGGVHALQAFFETVPDDLGVAFVVIIHLSPEYRSALPAILATRTSMPVRQVVGTVPLLANRVYVIPPDRRLQITDNSVSAVPFDEPRGRRAPIDLFFRSLAEHHGDAFAIVLSGGGSDGAVGVKAIKEAGGLVLVQDPAEAAHGSMPRAAIATEMADVVLPVRDLATRLGELTRVKRGLRTLIDPTAADRLDPDGEATLGHILSHVRARTGHDFTRYKRGTVLRRLGRRLQVQRVETLGDYLAFLRQHPDEVHALFADLLISVTTFFRNPEAWHALATEVVPRLFDRVDGNGPIRVWVPGCASGEEAYSVAILLLEEAHRRAVRPGVQIFASDLDERALAIARDGRYPRTIAADVSEERLHRFFRDEGEQYCVTKELRECVLFATHNLLRDPPFSRLDLVSCRNLLIYLDRESQEQVFGVFRYALRPGGTLFLGASETADGQNFRVTDKKHRVFQVRESTTAGAARLPDLLLTPRVRAPGLPNVASGATAAPPPAASGTVHRRLLEALAPPSILVDAERDAVHLSETVGQFLRPPSGPLTHDVTRLVRPELQPELQAALFHALDRGESTLTPFVPIEVEGAARRVALLVRPRTGDAAERMALVMFIEGDATAAPDAAPDDQEKSASLLQLQDELRQARQRLNSAHERFTVNTDELRAANEELQSINEEYRSTAEELETSREELQSTNEELDAVNAELKSKLKEISRAHDDLENLMAATEIGTLFLDRSLRIARFTPPVADLFSITEADRGRSISDFTHRLDYAELQNDARLVLKWLRPVERECLSGDGRWYLVRMRPYRSRDDRIEGVVLTFVDVTARREGDEALRRSEERYRLLVEGVEEYAMLMTDQDGCITTWNAGAKKLFGRTDEEAIGQPLAVLFTEEDRAAGVSDREMAVARKDGTASDDRWQARKDGTRFWANGVLTALRDAAGNVRGFAKILRDNTDRQAAEAARLHFRSLFESAPGLYLVLRPEDYTIVAASDSYLTAIMRRREEVLGRTVFDILPDDPADPHAAGSRNLCASLERVKAKHTVDVMAVQHHPVRRPTTEGGQFEDRWWSPVNSPVSGPTGGIAYIIHRVEDVTPFIRSMRDEAREAEGHRLLESRAQHMEAEVLLRAQELQRANDELRRLNDVLEERGVERERLLIAAQDSRAEAERRHLEALGASEAKTQFLATMSHELRTPLNAIAGHVQLLELELHGPVNAAQRDALARVDRAQRHLLTLINDVLNFARIGEGKLDYDVRPTDLGALMTDVVPMIETQLAAKGLAYEVRPPEADCIVWADADKLRQIVLNLLANAAKFTSGGGRVVVDVVFRPETPDIAYLRVQDTGIGIPREKQDMIFDPFVQVQRTFSNAVDGVGLGLTISRDLARGMGGDLRVRSTEGSGSAFTVALRRVGAGEGEGTGLIRSVARNHR